MLRQAGDPGGTRAAPVRVRVRLERVLARGTGADQQRAWRAGGADAGRTVLAAVERTLA